MLYQLAYRLVASLPPAWLRAIGRWQWAGSLQRRFVRSGSEWLRHADVTIRHGVGSGLRFNAGGANPGYALGTSEPLVQESLRQVLTEGAVFWDVGANVGFHTLIAARIVGPSGRVVAIEPLPANLAALRRNVALNQLANVTVIEGAASAKGGDVELQLGDEPTWARVAAAGPAHQAGSIRVRAFSLDDLQAAEALPHPDVVKIDVEGAECDVVAGMRGLIARRAPVIVCEMHGKNAEFAELLRPLGYELRVLEGDSSLEQARWDVHVIATPVGRPVA